MAVMKYTQEIKVRVSARRMFRALITDSEHVLAEVMPNAVKNVDVQGDGGPGTVKHTNFADGALYSYVKLRTDEMDIENCSTKYTLVDGPMLGDKLEKACYEQKFQDTSDGGCLVTVVSEYHTKGDVQLKEEDIKSDKDKAMIYYNLTEEYLLAHPDVFA